MKILVVILGVFLLFQNLIVLRVGYASPFNAPVKNIDEAAILGMFIVTVFKNVPKMKIHISRLGLLIFMFIAIGIASDIVNSVDKQVMLEGCFLMLKGFMLYYVVSNINFSDKQLKNIVKIFLAVGVIFIIGAIGDFISPTRFRSMVGNLDEIEFRGGMPSIISFFIHPGEFSWWMAYLFLFSCAAKIFYKRNIFLLIMLVFFIGVLSAMRTKAIVGSAVGLFIGVIHASPLKVDIRRIVFLFVILAIILLIFAVPILELLKNMQNQYIYAPDLSNVARNVLYATSFRIALDTFPFGAGFGRFGGWTSIKYYSDVYYKYGISTVYGLSEEKFSFTTDTFWAMILGETGFIGTIILILIFASFFKMMTLALVNGKNSIFENFLCLSAIMIFCEALVESIAAAVFHKPPQMYFIFAILGIVASISSRKRLIADET